VRAAAQHRANKMSMDFLKDFIAGGTSGCIAKCCTAPIERVKLIIQTQDANPKIISGEVPRYTGIGNCFTRVASEQGIAAFWRGNLVNCIRYFPTQACNVSSNHPRSEAAEGACRAGETKISSFSGLTPPCVGSSSRSRTASRCVQRELSPWLRSAVCPREPRVNSLRPLRSLRWPVWSRVGGAPEG